MMRWSVLLVAVFLLSACSDAFIGTPSSPPPAQARRSPNEVSLTDSTDVQFATAAQGKDALKAQDDFLRNVSLFDIQVRLQTAQEKSAQDLGEFQASAVREWTEQEKKTLIPILEDLRKKLKPLSLFLPKKILLVKTTGEEEGGAAYTRGNAIFIPHTRIGPSLQQTLAHEIFHVMSRHDRALRDKAYAFVGFKACNEISLPGDYANRRITNPDAPIIDSYIEIEEKGEKLAMTPVLFANKPKFDPITKGNLFSYLTFKLMAIENDGETWRPVIKNDGPIFIDAATNDSFMQQTGDNTKYIIHPEEIMADNFSYLVMGKTNLKTPRIVEHLKVLLDYKTE